MNDNQVNVNDNKVKKDSKYYYHNSPTFKQKHHDKMTEEWECECGCVVLRCNQTRYKKSKIHIENMQKKTLNKVDIMIDAVDELDLDELQTFLRKLRVKLKE